METSSAIPTEGDVDIYWELQGSDLMCGVHCLNSLLQGPFFTEVDLAEVAQRLDQKEKELMMEAGMENKEFLKFMAEESGNVAEEGNYSLQVLVEMLKTLGNIECLHTDQEEVKTENRDISSEQAFICNSSTHWFAIRKIRDTWYNLNSTNLEPGPEIISSFYLDAFLEATKAAGFSIFVVRGELPWHPKEFFEAIKPINKYQFWVSADYLEQYFKDNKRTNINVQDTDQRDLQRAMKESLESYNPGGDDGDDEGGFHGFHAFGSSTGKPTADNAQETNQFQAFSGAGKSLSGANAGGLQNSIPDELKFDGLDDEELQMALAMEESRKEAQLSEIRQKVKPEPELGEEGVVRLRFRLPDNTQVERRFLKTNLVADIYTFITVHTSMAYEVKLVTAPPRTEHTEKEITLESADILGGNVIVEKL